MEKVTGDPVEGNSINEFNNHFGLFFWKRKALKGRVKMQTGRIKIKQRVRNGGPDGLFLLQKLLVEYF